MNTVIESYVGPGFQYKFTHGPDIVRSREDALQYGINCVSLAHLVLREMFDYELPPELFCTELFYDREHLTEVATDQPLQAGDLVWLGTPEPTVSVEEFKPMYRGKQLVNWPQFPINHVAVFTGETTASNDPLLLHATHLTGTTCIWPLQTFATHRPYSKVYGTRRLKARTNHN